MRFQNLQYGLRIISISGKPYPEIVHSFIEECWLIKGTAKEPFSVEITNYVQNDPVFCVAAVDGRSIVTGATASPHDPEGFLIDPGQRIVLSHFLTTPTDTFKFTFASRKKPIWVGKIGVVFYSIENPKTMLASEADGYYLDEQLQEWLNVPLKKSIEPVGLGRIYYMEDTSLDCVLQAFFTNPFPGDSLPHRP